jgi:adenine deaminase
MMKNGTTAEIERTNWKVSEEMKNFIYEIPKAELHIHIEGTLEPELMLELAKRNKIELPYKDINEIKQKYEFKNLQEFLDVYYEACDCLRTESDFEDLMFSYLSKVFSQGLKYAEIFFDPQTHLSRNISFEIMMTGFNNGILKAKEKFNIEANLILSLLRHLSEEDAIKTLELAKPFYNDIIAIGLDSSEIGHPPEKFKYLYKMASELGLRLCAHGGEEGEPISYVKPAVDILKIDRLDHGIKLIEDESYLEEFVKKPIPMTLCPLSNIKLKNWTDLSTYPLRSYFEKDLSVTINSDDPAYFGGYLGDNYFALAEKLNLSSEEIIILAKNSFKASFLSSEKKDYYIKMIDKFVEMHSRK